MIFMAALLLIAAIVYVVPLTPTLPSAADEMDSCSATVIIVPRSAGASAPGIPEALLIRLIEGTGKSLRYRDSLAFDAREFRRALDT